MAEAAGDDLDGNPGAEEVGGVGVAEIMQPHPFDAGDPQEHLNPIYRKVAATRITPRGTWELTDADLRFIIDAVDQAIPLFRLRNALLAGDTNAISNVIADLLASARATS